MLREVWKDKISVDSKGCWLFTGPKTSKGYGWIKSRYAHRLMYEQIHGTIPQGLYVLHKCDVRNCVNPEHLYTGTARQNMVDRRAAGKYGHTEESREKIRVSKLGKKHSQESIEKMRTAKLGKKHSQEAKMKMSKTKLERREARRRNAV